MDNAFLQALNDRKLEITQKIDDRNKAKEVNPIDVQVNLMLTLKPAEIRVTFSRFPGQPVIDDFHNASSFKWSSVNKVWWAYDNQRNRDYVNARFHANLEPYADVSQPAPEPAKKPLEIVVAPAVAPEPDNSPFGVYKRQVDELCAHLKISPADLSLLAVNALHKATFGRN